jgi:hypothetical protein
MVEADLSALEGIKEVNPDEVKGSATGAINFLTFGVMAFPIHRKLANNTKGILARGNESVSLSVDKQHQVKIAFARKTAGKDQSTAPRVYGSDRSLAHSAGSGGHRIKPPRRPSLGRWPWNQLKLCH